MSLVETFLSTMPTPTGGATVGLESYSYDDANIQYLGRWIDTGSGIWNGWAGPQIVFTTSGTNYVIVHTSIIIPTSAQIELIASAIDNNSNPSTNWFLVPSGTVYTGLAERIIMLPDTGTHDIILHTNGFNADIFNQVSKATVLGFSVAPGATISSWAQGTEVLQCVGDSWMGAENDWPRLMDRSRWKLFPIATGGMKASDMDAQYNFNYAGNPATTDLVADAVIVSFGVNDYNAGVTLSAFETSLLSVVDKIRILQPSAPIYLVSIPDNIAASKPYGQYGPNMANIAQARPNVFYIDTSSLAATITWRDANHLDGPGKQMLASFTDTQIP